MRQNEVTHNASFYQPCECIFPPHRYNGKESEENKCSLSAGGISNKINLAALEKVTDAVNSVGSEVK